LSLRSAQRQGKSKDKIPDQARNGKKNEMTKKRKHEIATATTWLRNDEKKKNAMTGEKEKYDDGEKKK